MYTLSSSGIGPPKDYQVKGNNEQQYGGGGGVRPFPVRFNF